MMRCFQLTEREMGTAIWAHLTVAIGPADDENRGTKLLRLMGDTARPALYSTATAILTLFIPMTSSSPFERFDHDV